MCSASMLHIYGLPVLVACICSSDVYGILKCVQCASLFLRFAVSRLRLASKFRHSVEMFAAPHRTSTGDPCLIWTFGHSICIWHSVVGKLWMAGIHKVSISFVYKLSKDMYGEQITLEKLTVRNSFVFQALLRMRGE